jgi:molybdate transport system substrate-binding protein
MIKIIHKVFLLILFIFLENVSAKEIIVFAAADLVYTLNEVKDLYNQKNPKDKIKIIYGSSGKGYSQILHGAPIDIFFSANIEYIEKLKEKNLTASEIQIYAIGRIVVWWKKENKISVKDGIDVLLNPNIKKIAIANWKHAPYGMAAKECLEFYKIFDRIQDKLVFGENISQTAQYIQIGAADVGIIALSLAKSEFLKKEGEYSLLPENCHKQIKQAYVILKHATSNEEKKIAKRFYDYIQTKESRNIFKKYGFLLPNEINNEQNLGNNRRN